MTELAGDRAWEIREALRPWRPTPRSASSMNGPGCSTGAISSARLAATSRGGALLDTTLARHPTNVALWRHALRPGGAGQVMPAE